MSLFGALYTSVSGLNAQSQATAIISNNIANVNTVGFKRSDATFAALVTTESAAARYSPGAVQLNRLQRIDEQGQISQSSSTTDIALSGDGFFVVRDQNETSEDGQFLYTRNGQFFEDQDGRLVNSAGKYLYGWPVSPLDGDPSQPVRNTVFNPDLSALTTIDVGLATGRSQVTTEAQLGINLNADQIDREINQATGLVDYPSVVDFSRTLRTFDSLGSAQDVTFEFIKVFGPQAATVSGVDGLGATDLLESEVGIPNGATFDFDFGGNGTETFGPVGPTTTVNDLLEFINNYDGVGGGTGGFATATLNADGEIAITGIDFQAGDTITLTDGAIPLLVGLGITTGTLNPAAGFGAGTSPAANFDGTFPDLVNTPGSSQFNPGGWWQLNIVGPNPAIPLSQGLINFNSDGSLNAQVDADGNRDIELTGVNWGNFSDLQNIDIDITAFSQFADFYNVAFASQNGSELGLQSSVEIDNEGFVNARFSNGQIARLFKLPIATFASPPNLQEISGTAYAESADSGTVLLQEAGVSSAGTIVASTLELSNVDLAEEFSKLIITQRAYSANTRVITTVDQMTEDLLRLR